MDKLPNHASVCPELCSSIKIVPIKAWLNAYKCILPLIFLFLFLLLFRSTFTTTNNQSHYLFTPRDLTQWVINLLRYKINSEASSSSTEEVLEVWSYGAKRSFWDRLVGKKVQKTFDSSLLMSEWSIDLSQHENETSVYYVTWTATSTSSVADQAQKYDHSLGRLTARDLKEVVTKGILSNTPRMLLN